jgi:hypothetical protein
MPRAISLTPISSRPANKTRTSKKPLLESHPAAAPIMQRSKLMAAVFLLAAGALCASENPVSLFPKLHAGQKLLYLIRYRAETNAKTESRVAVPMAPTDAQVDAHGLLQIEILDLQPAAGRAKVHARARFLTLDSGVWLKNPEDKSPNWTKERVDPEGKAIEFTISVDGHLENVSGIETLVLDQQRAWWEWVTRFALAWTLPTDIAKVNEKQKSEQPLGAGSPIAELRWDRVTTYAKNEPCQPSELTLTGEISPSVGAPDFCAVLVTTASLKQKSSVKDTTPEDYKLHQLKTSGTAKGTSQLITYISLTSGLVVRATEESAQLMNVVVALADGSNRVRYNVEAKSNSQVLLITETPLTQP